jgi:hypothetical protein
MMRGVLILLAGCRWAFALNPSLDVSQYAHTAWTVRDYAANQGEEESWIDVIF